VVVGRFQVTSSANEEVLQATMKIFSWNVNGLRSVVKKGTFQSFLTKHEPDVLCLQETRSGGPQDIAGYHQYFHDAEKKGYSGTAIFSKTKPLSVTNGVDGLNLSKEEGRVLTAEFAKYFVVSVYTPNAKDDQSRLQLRAAHWDPGFLSYCKKLEATKPVVICGDLNVAHTELDLANPKQNRGKKGFTAEERQGFDNLINASFLDTLRLFKQGNGFYTWWSHFAKSRERNVGWRIDYILVSSSLRGAVETAEIHSDVLGSDHCPISVKLQD